MDAVKTGKNDMAYQQRCIQTGFKLESRDFFMDSSIASLAVELLKNTSFITL